MRWPDITPKQLLAIGIAMYVVLSMAAIQGAIIDLPTSGSEPTTDGETPTAGDPDATAPTAAGAHYNQSAAQNCSAVLANGSAGGPRDVLSDSGPRHPLESIIAGGNSSAGSNPFNGTALGERSVGDAPSSLERACKLYQAYAPPEWVTEMAASAAASDSRRESDGSKGSIDTYTTSSPTARAQLELARDLRTTLTDESRTRPEATFDATAQALASRQVMIEDRANASLQEHLDAERTSLRGAQALVSETERMSHGDPLASTTRLAETGVAVQAAQVSNASDAKPTSPGAVDLPEPPSPSYDAPSTAVFAIIDTHNVDPTNEQAAGIRSLDEVPNPTRRELTDLLNAYLGYYRAVDATASTDPGAPPNVDDVQKVRAAQLELLAAASDLQTALEDGGSDGVTAPAAKGPSDGGVQVAGIISIDLSTADSTYETDYQLQVDVGGDDTYHNNAGGAKAAGKSTDASALIDLGGADTYTGRNGGGWYEITEESPPTRKAKQGAAAGFLLDVGTASDEYTSRTTGETIEKRYFPDVTIPAGSRGTNGGGRRAIGFLVDTGGNDTYEAGKRGTNGGGDRKGAGFLLDAGSGSDTYVAGTGGTNGGSRQGVGFLFDAGGRDTYNAKGRATNGGGHGISRAEGGFPGPYFGPIRKIQLLFDVDLPTGGFLVDASGTDSYTGMNGGANRFGKGFLLDYGKGDDTYDGRNGGAKRKSVGVLVDTGGNDTYAAGNGGENGGANGGALGFLLDGGTGADTYDATTHGVPRRAENVMKIAAGSKGVNGGGHGSFGKSRPLAAGFLLDAGGTDTYLAGSLGANGGSAGSGARGFLLDMGGNETYRAKKGGVNGGATSGTGLLYDNTGSDFYTDYNIRCRDCSEVPKGSVGAQVDRGGSGGATSESSESTEVLVVDGNSPSDGNGCSDATYEAIQPAVNDAEFGDTIRVCAGTYPGNVTVNTPNVTLRATESGQVVLNGENTRRYGVALLASDTSVDGFTATNFSRPTGFDRSPDPKEAGTAFLTIGPDTTIANSTVRNSHYTIVVTGFYTESSFEETPIDAGGSGQPTVIRNNTVTNSTFGIIVTQTGNVNISGNKVRGTKDGIVLRFAEQVTVHKNTVSGKGVQPRIRQYGILSVFSSEVTISDNVVTEFGNLKHRNFTEEDTFGPFSTKEIGYGHGIAIHQPLGEGSDVAHTMRNNRLADNTYNFLVKSGDRSDYKHFDIDASNTVNGKPIVYLIGATNVTIGPADDSGPDLSGTANSGPTDNLGIDVADNPGYVACIKCVDVTVRNLELAHNGQGVLIAKSREVLVNNVRVHDTWRGISLEGSPTNAVVRDSTILRSSTAISVRHNCGNRRGDSKPGGGTIRRIAMGDSEVCAPPSVTITNNVIRHTGEPTGQAAIRVAGTGVMIRENSITDAEGVGISINGKPSYTGGNGILNTGRKLSADTVVDSAVIDNSITDAFTGVRVAGSEGTTFRDNTIADSRIGFYNIWNTGLVFRENTVSNVTQGMFIHWSNVDFRARNNAFRNVRWGLHVQFTWYATPPGAQATHDFGTSNTVNGEQILWIREATHRTIEAEDANMVVCIKCVDVTIRDMTLTDNAHGVVLWDSTNSRVINVTVLDTLQAGINVIDGQENVVRNSKVIGSVLPILAAPIDGRRFEKNQRETIGPVRVVNNTIKVGNQSWPGPPWHGFTNPLVFGHLGITLFNPTIATVKGNRVTNNRWGIVQFASRLAGAEGCFGASTAERCDPPARAYDLTISNNTVTHPKKELGFDRFVTDGPFIFGRTLGIRIKVKANDVPGANIQIRNNTLKNPITHYSGITLAAQEVPSMNVTGNRVEGYKRNIQIDARGNNSTISIRQNRLVGARRASVAISMATPGDAVEIHQNLLHANATVGVKGYGVFYGGEGSMGGHMGKSGSSVDHELQPVDARCNRWGPPSGPGSRPMTLVDPATGESADGNGSRVTHGHKHGVSNVRFHPWLGKSPELSCTEDLAGTPMPTPPPTPTRTPWPFGTPTPGIGSGDGPGNGPGDGPGDGSGDGPGEGSTGNRGGEGPNTATFEVRETATLTATPPPTATPEIVPGFGVNVWVVAFVLVVGLLAVRRRG